MYQSIINYFNDKNNLELTNFEIEFNNIMKDFENKNFNYEDINSNIIDFIKKTNKFNILMYNNNLMDNSLNRKDNFYIKLYDLYNRLFSDSLKFIINQKLDKIFIIYKEIKDNYDVLNITINGFKIIKKEIRQNNLVENEIINISEKFGEYCENVTLLIKELNKGSDNCDFIDSKLYYQDLIIIIESYRNKIFEYLKKYLSNYVNNH